LTPHTTLCVHSAKERKSERDIKERERERKREGKVTLNISLSISLSQWVCIGLSQLAGMFDIP